MMKNGLTGNQLKLIAVVTMTLDHIGLMLLPQYPFLRLIGRLAFPIYAWMIAEGCRYTHNYAKYLGMIAGFAALYQAVYYVAMGSLYQCILVTFSMSILLIRLVKEAREKGGIFRWLLSVAGVLSVLFVTDVLPVLLPGTDFAVDYGFLGVILPVCIYCGRTEKEKLAAAALVLLAMGWSIGTGQWFALAALPLLACYNGKRGKRKLKYFFYIYYPAHLVIIYFVENLIK